MIHTVDKNGDGKISYSEFRVMMGAPPLLHTLSGHNCIDCDGGGDGDSDGDADDEDEVALDVCTLTEN